MDELNNNLDIDSTGDLQNEAAPINLENFENIKLILDLESIEDEEAAQIEFESICPPISEDVPEEFFYDDSMDLIEVEFKGARRAYFYKDKELQLSTMDYVIVEAEKGCDLGKVYLTGDLVHIKRKGQVLRKDIIRKVIKKAEQPDLEKMMENRQMEEGAFLVCRKKIEKHELVMKLVDVEYQYDRNRVTFFFTSDKRIDFRELVKDLASEYRTRIELRQIGVRDEAKMIGGISGCGRELCCCTWLNDFKRITTQTAKVQMLHLNPVKLSGQCGRLKCCLMYELDSYTDSLKWFPELESKVDTPKGDATVEKIDIFKDTLYLHYSKDDTWEKFDLHVFNDLYHSQFPSTLIKECKCEKVLDEEDSFMLPINFGDDSKLSSNQRKSNAEAAQNSEDHKQNSDNKGDSSERKPNNNQRNNDRNNSHSGQRNNENHKANNSQKQGNGNRPNGNRPQNNQKPSGGPKQNEHKNNGHNRHNNNHRQNSNNNQTK